MLKDAGRSVFIVSVPTPQRIPLFNALHQMDDLSFEVIYEDVSDGGRGWGDLGPMQHPYVILSGTIMRRWRTVVGAVRQEDVALVAVFGYDSWLKVAAIIITRLYRKRLAIRSDTNWTRDAKRPLMRFLLKKIVLRLLLGRGARIWTIGRRNAEYWSRYGFNNQWLIPYIVPVPPLGTASGAESVRQHLNLGRVPVVLYVGRLEPNKGITQLLNAAELLIRRNLTFALVIAGEGSMAGMVRGFAERHKYVRSVGAVRHSDLGNYYRLADLVVVPSLEEPWSLVVNEALANGAPVLASDAVGAADDLIADGRLRYPAADVLELTERLGSLLIALPARHELRASAVAVATMLADELRSPVQTDPSSGGRRYSSRVVQAAARSRRLSRPQYRQ